MFRDRLSLASSSLLLLSVLIFILYCASPVTFVEASSHPFTLLINQQSHSTCPESCTSSADCPNGCHCHAAKCMECAVCDGGEGSDTGLDSGFSVVIGFENSTIMNFMRNLAEKTQQAIADIVNHAYEEFEESHDHEHETDDDHEGHLFELHPEDIVISSVVQEEAHDHDHDHESHAIIVRQVETSLGTAVATYNFPMPDETEAAQFCASALDTAISGGTFAQSVGVDPDHVHLEQATKSNAPDLEGTTDSCDTTCRSWKIGFIFFLLFLGVAGGMLPLVVPKIVEKLPWSMDNIILYMDVFSGGIIFSTAITHLLPHAYEDLLPYEIVDWEEYPFTATMFIVGFLFVFGVEGLLMPLLIHSTPKEAVGKDMLDLSSKLPTDMNPANPRDISDSFVKSLVLREQAQVEATENTVEDMNDDSIDKVKSAKSSSFDMSNMSLAVVIFVGYSFHSFISGIACGIGGWDVALSLFIAEASHKAFATFSLGAELAGGKCSYMIHFLIILAQSVISPVAIAIGMGVRGSGNPSPLVTGILTALSAGMLGYVGSIGTTQSFFVKGNSKLKTFYLFLNYISGVTVMIIVAVILTFTGVHQAAHG